MQRAQRVPSARARERTSGGARREAAAEEPRVFFEQPGNSAPSSSTRSFWSVRGKLRRTSYSGWRCVVVVTEVLLSSSGVWWQEERRRGDTKREEREGALGWDLVGPSLVLHSPPLLPSRLKRRSPHETKTAGTSIYGSRIHPTHPLKQIPRIENRPRRARFCRAHHQNKQRENKGRD